VVQPVNAALVGIEQKDLGDQVEISVVASDTELLKQLFYLGEEDLNLSNLASSFRFDDAWTVVPYVADSLEIMRPLNGQADVIPDDPNLALTIQASIADGSQGPISENEVLFRFNIFRPLIKKGEFSLMNIFFGSGIDITNDDADIQARLAEIGVENGKFAQITIEPTVVPLPGAHLFLLTGMLFVTCRRRLSKG
jgi:hypothetical protein